MSEHAERQISENYEPILNAVSKRAETKEALEKAATSEIGSEILDMESSILEVSPEDNPDTFLAKHNELLDTYKADLEERLPDVTDDVVERAASHLSKGDNQIKRQLITMFQSRLAATRGVDVDDPLVNPSKELGDFREVSRRVVVNGRTMMRLHGQSQERIQDVLDKQLLPHEILHAVSTAQIETGAIQNEYATLPLPVRSGLALRLNPGEGPMENASEAVQMGQWVNEAFMEDFRSKIMETEEVGYKPNLMVLKLAQEFDPGLEQSMEAAVFQGDAPGIVVGRLEETFGPLGVEGIQEIINQYTHKPPEDRTDEEYVTFRRSIVALVESNRQEEASAMLDQLNKEITSIAI